MGLTRDQSPMIDRGYWPPQTGSRVKGFETATPKLICVPFIGDIQTFTYRNDVYTGGPPKTWDEVIEKGKAVVAAGKIKYPVVFDGAEGNPMNLLAPSPVVLRGRLSTTRVHHLQFRGRQGVGGLPRHHIEAESASRGGRVSKRPAGRRHAGRRLRRDDPIYGQRPGIG